MEGLKILVVDDEARMRKLVKDFLVNKGFSVIEAADGEEAVDVFFAQKDIALVILDVMMPKMDGWEVLKTIRKYSQVPVIMLTARGEERDELQGFALGVDEYISKPFSPKILVARVDAILRRSNAAASEVLDVGGMHTGADIPGLALSQAAGLDNCLNILRLRLRQGLHIRIFRVEIFHYDIYPCIRTLRRQPDADQKFPCLIIIQRTACVRIFLF